jgi:CubicO group peptidase (beta-lactamase class C family)
LKTILITLSFLAIVNSCNEASSHADVKEDSLQYYPPTPRQIDKQEFRYYNRILSDFFESKLIRHGFNGSILVAKDGAVLYEKYVGYGDLRKKDALTDSTALHIASTGKTLTGMAVLRLVQENRLSLEDSIQSYFPGFPYEGVTVKTLLNHRSGLPNYLYFLESDKTYKNQYITNNDVLEYLMTKKPNRSFKPDTRFSYSNTNYVMLALLIEKITGQTFAAFMKEKVFGPLQMKDTYVYSLADSATAVPSFNYNNSHWQNDRMEGTVGDKNIYSTPKDLLKWDQALYTDQFLRPSLLDSAFQPYSNERPSIHNYGLAWRMLNLPGGKKVIYHFGRWHGFNAAFARLLDEKVTIIILGNKFNRGIYSTANKAYDLFGNYDRNGGGDDDDEEKAGIQRGSKTGVAALAAHQPSRK